MDDTRVGMSRPARPDSGAPRRASHDQGLRIVAGSDSATHDPQVPTHTQEATALAFAAEHHGEMVYVPVWKKWLIWSGGRWREEKTLRVRRRMRRSARTVHLGQDRNPAPSMMNARFIVGAEYLAQSDKRLARDIDDFDVDPWELNCPDGVVDLRTGKLRSHDPHTDLFLKVAGATPDPHCHAPQFLTFLRQITEGDAARVKYLLRWGGYTLTGTVREHAFLILYGTGGNGKGVLLSTIAAALGDYAVTATEGLLTEGVAGHRHPSEIAALRGARMVVIPELDAKAWAEPRLKSLTGGDRVTAWRMRADPETFDATGKIWIAANHLPKLKNADPAMHRRLNVVPCPHRPMQADEQLGAKLREELPGILQLLIQGCLDWQCRRLLPPESVRKATDAYFAEQDGIGIWLAERCDRVPIARTGAAALFHDWEAWCATNGRTPGTAMEFSDRMRRDFERSRGTQGRVYHGVALRAPEPRSHS